MPRFTDPVDQMHHAFWELDKRWRFLAGDTKAVEKRYKPHVLALLRAAGFSDLQVGVCGSNDPVDLVVNGWRVELKVSRNVRKRPHYYQALLRDPGNHHHLDGDFIMLVCVTSDGALCPFVIPIEAVGSRRTVEITSDPWQYAGRWARYRGAFHLLQAEV